MEPTKYRTVSSQLQTNKQKTQYYVQYLKFCSSDHCLLCSTVLATACCQSSVGCHGVALTKHPCMETTEILSPQLQTNKQNNVHIPFSIIEILFNWPLFTV